MTPHPASTDADSSSVILRVSSIERATRFSLRDVLGFRVVVYGPDLGLQAAFLAAGVRQQFLLTTYQARISQIIRSLLTLRTSQSATRPPRRFQSSAASPALGLRNRRVLGGQWSRCGRSPGAQWKPRATSARPAPLPARGRPHGRESLGGEVADHPVGPRSSRATNRRRRACLVTSA